MNDEQMEELIRACATVSENITKLAESLSNAFDIVAANFSDMVDDLCDYYEGDNMAELLQTIERLKESESMADFADDYDAIIPAPKLPRPPKRIGPVNKANYTSNRPKRQARSSLYKKAR